MLRLSSTAHLPLDMLLRTPPVNWRRWVIRTSATMLKVSLVGLMRDYQRRANTNTRLDEFDRLLRRKNREGDVTVRTSTFSVEVITVPVSDVERALRFYVDQVGFTLDVDYSPNDDFRVVQLTPPGSSCSIQMAIAGCYRNSVTAMGPNL